MPALRGFEEVAVLGIIRGIERSYIKDLAETAVAAGLKAIEITMNTPDAPRLIEDLVSISAGRMHVGAGTVLTNDDLEKAIRSGSEFVVAPVYDAEISSECKKNNMPYIAGAFTPTEVFTAWKNGAYFIKVFPASSMGPGYIRQLKGPFNEIKIMAVGGVDEKNAPDYLRNGADAVAFGSGIIDPELVKNGQFDIIGDRIRSLISSVKIER